jgi:PAS domain S-box-containing protein
MTLKWLNIVVVLLLLESAVPTILYSDTPSDRRVPEKLSSEKMDHAEWVARNPVITIHGPEFFPPFFFLTSGSVAEGMSLDYLRLIASRQGLILRIFSGDGTGGGERKTETGGIDLRVCGSDPSDRDRIYSKPYLSFPLVIITRKNASFVSGLQDLKGRKVACVLENGSCNRLELAGMNIEPVFMDTTNRAFAAVSTGEVDAYIENLAVASYVIEKKGYLNLKITAPTGLGNENLCFSTDRRNRKLITLIDNELDRLTPEDHSAIRNRWLSVRYEYGINPRDVAVYIGGLCGVAALLVMIFLYWNRKLKKEVDERKKTEAALRQSEQRFRDISMSVGDMIWEVDDKGRFTYISETVTPIFGYQPGELIGKTHFDMMDDAESRRFRNLFKIISQDSNPMVDKELWYMTKDRKRVCLLTNGIPIMEGDKGVLGYRGVGKDVTRQKKLEDEKKKMEEQLKQTSKMEAVGTLAGGIAHDFNNILGIIIGNTELAISDTPEWSTIRQNLDEIKKASIRARNVVRQLLSFSRKTEQERRPLKIQDVLEETVALLRSTVPSSIDIRTIVSEKTSPILADSTQLHQVVLNLCSNAIHAMEENGGILEISLMDLAPENRSLLPVPAETPKDRKWVHFSFRDTGHGISPDIRDRIFDPYFTTKDVGKGTGIGLSVVMGVVKNNEGAISIDSEPEKGTTVHLLFPAVESYTETVSKIPDTLPTGNERILFVDDETSIVAIAELLLRRQGYSVTSATNPLEALEIFSAAPDDYDLIISDMTMPYIMGDRLVKKCLEIRNDIPVILCSGFSETITEETAGKIGIKRLLDKPLDMRLMAVSVRQVLDGVPG